MLVTKENFKTTVELLSMTGQYGLDTETTGLKHTDRLFSIIIADSNGAYYFNFLDYGDGDSSVNLPRSLIKELHPIFSNPDSTFFIHNAPFDLMKLSLEGLTVDGKVQCSLVGERILKNNFMSYKLAFLARIHLKQKKDDAVEAWIKENKAYTIEIQPGKSKKNKLKHYDKVPLPIIHPYGEQDTHLHLKLGKHQLRRLQKDEELLPVWENEQRLVRTCTKMMQAGIQIDIEYTEKALLHELELIQQLKDDFEARTGREFKDSSKEFREIWDETGAPYKLTDKGNPSFNKEALEASTHPLAELILDIRGKEKRANTYYSSFLYYKTGETLHSNIRQSGTETGRMSMSSPSLHNVPKEGEDEDKKKPFNVRKCFVPRKGKLFVMLDYDQQEFRMLLDYAGEHALIKKVNEGHDVHQAAADLTGMQRQPAKHLQFGILYGLGTKKLAIKLKKTFEQAFSLKMVYFNKLPRVEKLMKQIKRVSVQRGWIRNWFGRKLQLKDPNKSYIMINHLIQGGCADVIKVAMNRIDDYMIDNKLKSKMLLQVHDELVFEMEPDELHHIENFKTIMENVYKPLNGMLLTCSIEHSFVSWGSVDRVSGLPTDQDLDDYRE